MRIRLHALAVDDIESAVDHYREEASKETALDFVDALEGAINHLQHHPFSGSLRFAFELDIPELRNWPLQKFPYVIFYVASDNDIDIWRILHPRQNISAHFLASRS